MKGSLVPRYRLDDDSSWLLAIDPVRHSLAIYEI